MQHAGVRRSWLLFGGFGSSRASDCCRANLARVYVLSIVARASAATRRSRVRFVVFERESVCGAESQAVEEHLLRLLERHPHQLSR